MNKHGNQTKQLNNPSTMLQSWNYSALLDKVCEWGLMEPLETLFYLKRNQLTLYEYEMISKVACKHNKKNIIADILILRPCLFIILFNTACLVNNLPLVRDLSDVNPYVDISTGVYNACKSNNFKIVQFLLRRNPYNFINTKDHYKNACIYGHLETMQILLDADPSIFAPECLVLACKNGHLHILKWLMDTMCSHLYVPFVNDGFREACLQGHVEIVQLLFHKHSSVLTKNRELIHRCWFLSIVRNRMTIVEFFLQKLEKQVTADYLEKGFVDACSRGYLTIAKLLLHKKPCINIQTNNHAAFKKARENDNISVLEWLHMLEPDIYVYDAEEDVWRIRFVLPIVFGVKIKVPHSECSICYDTSATMYSTNCKHTYCLTCIQKFYQSETVSCPYCRKTIDSFLEIYDD